MNYFFTKLIFATVITLFSFNTYADSSYIKLNFGISSNEVDATASSGTISTDDEDVGFILSGGALIGDNWGIDVMYYDMGDSTITVTSDDVLKINGSDYAIYSGGDITRNVTGLGAGFIATSNSDGEFLSTDIYVKLGLHAWDKEGSTTLTDGNSAFNSKYYNEGIGAYAGAGFAVNVFENTSLDFSYDIIGVSSNGDFDNSSSLLSAGIRIKF